jgi:hypothetical protein
MNGAQKAGAGVARLPSAERAGFILAYREGLALACITIICDAAGTRISATAPIDHEGDSIRARWWCRRAADAGRVAVAAMRQTRRRVSRDAGMLSAHKPPAEDSRSVACDAVLAAASRLNVVLQSDDEIAAEALLVAARVDAEIEKLQQSGGLKSLNKSYRSYRLEANARGERIVRYREWMRRYRDNLVRQAARALRNI